MTDDISNYRFDFEKEAQDLGSTLASMDVPVLFVEVDVVRPRKFGDASTVSIKSLVSNASIENLSPERDAIVQWYKDDPYLSSQGGAFTGALKGNAVSMREREPFTESLGMENKNVKRLFTLYHETGHVLIPDADGPVTDKYHPFRECAADAYAALRLFQRFGQDAEPLLSMISWECSSNAFLTDDTGHLATAVLDKIIADSAQRDFSKLTPAETVALANTYAKEWTPKESMLDAVRSNGYYYNMSNFSLFCKTCLAAPDDFSFYIGAKFFQPFFQPEGVLWNGETIKISDKDRQQYAALIEKRAAGLSLSTIFNAVVKPAAEPPLTELLKVSHPAGQKQITMKT